MGVRHITSRTYHSVLRTSKGQLIYEADYSFDAFGRRTTYADGPPKGRSIVFFGASFVEGGGVNDGDTIPSQTAKRAHGYDVFNYGLGSSGPQQMLLQIERTNFAREGVSPDVETVGIYVFHDFQVECAIGSMTIVTSFGRDFPYYELEPDGRVVHHGTFLTGRPVRSLVYRALNKSHLVHFALQHGADWPRTPSPRDYETTGAIIAEAKAAFLRRFPHGRFVTVLYPGVSTPSVRPWLAAGGVEVLDLSGLFDPRAPGLSIPLDEHPTPEANARFSARIVEALGL
jgi:hypothetical protein